MVLQGTGEDLRTAGGEGVDQNHYRQFELLHLPPLRPDLLRQRRLAVRGADDDTVFRQEDRGKFHRRPDQSARIVAQIDDERTDFLLFQPVERGAELPGGMGVETFNPDVADRTSELLHRIRRHRGADHLRPLHLKTQQVLRPLPGHLEPGHAADRAPGECKTALQVEPLRQLAVDLHQPVPGLHPRGRRRRAGQDVDHQQRRIRLFDDLHAEADQFAGPPRLVGGELLRRLVTGIGIEISHHPPQRRSQQLLVADLVRLHVVVVQKFDGLREDRRLAVGFFTDQRPRFVRLRRAPASGESGSGQGQQRRQNQSGSRFHLIRLLSSYCIGI